MMLVLDSIYARYVDYVGCLGEVVFTCEVKESRGRHIVPGLVVWRPLKGQKTLSRFW